MMDLVIGILEVVGVIALFLGVVYLIQRSHKSEANDKPAASPYFPKLTGISLLGVRLLLAWCSR